MIGKKESVTSTTYSLVTVKSSRFSSNVEYLYFQIYTHNTGIYNTMADEVMGTEMSEWVMDVVTMIVMTLITMVRYSRILARHDNPSLYPSHFHISFFRSTTPRAKTRLFFPNYA